MTLTLYHCPGTRSGSAVWLLEELGVAYELEIVPVGLRGDPPESYRAIHPHKKVPAIVHDGVAVTERAAIFAYLCDAFPQTGLAPPIGDPRRGPYLSWLVYNDAVIDPVLAAKFGGWQYDKRGVSFGAFEDMV
ncbi:MAG TPA: glutathione S-transferase N-terminal domain-containing protein, partial [Caulobacteraceae bacterium]|nr:glutathione S-transferase N-terminal domain-containing protein [Caulobacteraceae bacterium]